MAIEKDVLDQLLAGRDPQELFAKDGLIDELKKALSERMLAAELDDHLEFGDRSRRHEPTERQLEEDGADGLVEGDARYSPRPFRDLRSEADRQISTAIS